MLRGSEVVIHEGNFQQFVSDPVVEGETKRRGLIPRNYLTHPLGCYGSIVGYRAVDMPLIPRSEWSERIKDKVAQKSQLSDFRLAGNQGNPIPSLDQNGKGYCFPAGVPVRMADGTLKPIERVELGDLVLGHSLKPCRVGETHRRLYTGDIMVLSPDGMDPVPMTADHYVATPLPGGSGFVDSLADGATAGDTVYGFADGRLGPRRLRHVARKAVRNVTVFDIGVEDEHHFLAGAGGLLVHNCWAHSSTSAVLMLRAVANQPYVGLSAYAIACIIKNYRDEGGWGAQSLDFITSRGVPSDQFWPQRSMSRENDKPATWDNAKLHRVAEGWVDLEVAQYDRKLSFDQEGTCYLCNLPVVKDENWWGHSICGLDLVDGTTNEVRLSCRADSGKLATLEEYEVVWGVNDPVTAGYGVRIWNSWGEGWSDRGMGVLTGQKAVSDGACSPRTTFPSVV